MNGIPKIGSRPDWPRIGARWIRKNLFNSWGNAVLTLLALWIVYAVAGGLVNWGVRLAVFRGSEPGPCRGVAGACWPVIKDMWPLFMVGTYPFEQRYRPLLALILAALPAVGILWPRLRRSRFFAAGWLVAVGVAFVLIRGGAPSGLPLVDTSLWGGLLLTVLLSLVGITLAFPIGILLALGRRSRMPIIHTLSVAYIELIRGVPLITILFMASVLLPLFFPEGFHMDKLVRAQIGIVMFAAAYQAEVMRGGLQGLPAGQQEAAAALGLNYWQANAFIVLPQALRIVIPPMVSQFIALLKDTSLVTIIGLFDLLGVTTLVTANPKWVGKITETYFFVAVIFWALCFSMSRYAMRLEKRLSAVER